MKDQMGIPYQMLFIILLFVLCFLTICAGCFFFDTEPYNFYSGAEFEMRIETSEPLTNATFYLPLPVKNGVPKMGDFPLQESDFGKTGYFITFTDSPPGLNLRDAYPVPDGRPLFVNISANIMRADSAYRFPNTSYEVSMYKITNHNNPRLFLNTLLPVGNESVILPKFEFSPPSLTRVTGKFSADKIGYRYTRIPQSIPIFADYSTSPSAVVSVSLSIYSYNGWRQETTSLGNQFTDSVYWGQTGESHGWQYARGDFTPGVGVYPDFSHPIWQNVMRRYQGGK